MARNISDSGKVLSPTACGRSPLAEGAKEFCDKRGILPEGEGLFLFTVPMMNGLQLELKVAGILGKLAREDDARDKQQQRRH